MPLLFLIEVIYSDFLRKIKRDFYTNHRTTAGAGFDGEISVQHLRPDFRVEQASSGVPRIKNCRVKTNTAVFGKKNHVFIMADKL